jgi:hypothetical protein
VLALLYWECILTAYGRKSKDAEPELERFLLLMGIELKSEPNSFDNSPVRREKLGER